MTTTLAAPNWHHLLRARGDLNYTPAPGQPPDIN
jgi:hypothetical protein